MHRHKYLQRPSPSRWELDAAILDVEACYVDRDKVYLGRNLVPSSVGDGTSVKISEQALDGSSGRRAGHRLRVYLEVEMLSVQCTKNHFEVIHCTSSG